MTTTNQNGPAAALAGAGEPSIEPAVAVRPGVRGIGRQLLRLLVGIHSSRSIVGRFSAGLVFVLFLAGFAAIGYWLPALLWSRS